MEYAGYYTDNGGNKWTGHKEEFYQKGISLCFETQINAGFSGCGLLSEKYSNGIGQTLLIRFMEAQ